MRPDAVLHYWFGADEADPLANLELWFKGGEAVDREIRARFGNVVEEAIQGGLQDWAGTPAGRTALIVVLDQFTRNVYRDDPRAFAGDARAQRLALQALEDPTFGEWPMPWRMFVLMPLMHAEDLAIHERLEREAERVLREDGEAWHGFVTSQRDHTRIVERFGRFPDRNRLLGRPSTPEERAFLETEHREWFERQ